MSGNVYKTLLTLLVYGLIMHCNVYCSPDRWTPVPGAKLEEEVYDEDGNTLQDFALRAGAPGGGGPRPRWGRCTALYYPPGKSGASSGLGDEAEPLSKRHIDGIFTDSYSRYRKQMAVKKYLAAVLGKRYKQRVKNKGRRVAYL
uniref:Isoform GRF 33-46 of Glucagon family neuropeptides n=1 Tax=Gallus gallus TaxID=9031 RepID=P41534-3|nr:growth hormone-releasing hormone/pituitary adenylate cyclase-activating polypeptide precursor [Gallus gallus]